MKIEIRKLDESEVEKKEIRTWPIWEKEISSFDWHYEQREECFLLAGRVRVRTDAGEVSFGKGDFVIFPQGLSCRWNVLEPVRKHYQFT